MKKHLIPLAIVLTICSSLPLFAMELSVQSQKEKIETYMTEGANLDNYDHNGNPPLVFAAQNNDCNLVYKLVAFGASVNTQALNGSTPLSEAVRCRNFNVVNFLLDHGAQSDIPDEKGDTALSLALDYNLADVAQRMVSGGNQSESKKSRTVKKEEKKNSGEKELPQKGKVSSKKAKVTFSHFKAQLSAGVDTVKLLMTNHKKNASQQQSALHDFFNKKMNSYDKQSYIEGHSQLVSALYSNNMQKIEALLEGQSFDINQQDSIMGLTPLAEACFIGNYRAVKKFINTREALIELPDNKGLTPIMRSISQKHDRIVRFLIKKGTNINAQDHDGETTLIKAICFGTPQTVDLLIDLGADVNISDNNGSGPLFFAVTNTNLSLVEKLIDRGANIDGHASNTAPLLEALRKRNAPIAQFLIKHGANCKARGQDGITALKKAKRNLELQHLIPLMKEQISSQPQESEETSPLNSNVETSEEIKKFLHKMDVGLKLNFAQNSSRHVLRISDWYELTNNGVDISKSDNDGITPLLKQAIRKGKYSAVEWLIEIGANEEVAPLPITIGSPHDWFEGRADKQFDIGEGITGLLLPIAIADKQFGIVQWLINKAMDIHKGKNRGITTLLWAIENKETYFAQYLIAKCVNINTSNNEGVTPLMLALENNETVVAESLIEAGADIYKGDKDGITPLLLAIANKESEI